MRGIDDLNVFQYLYFSLPVGAVATILEYIRTHGTRYTGRGGSVAGG